MTSNERKNIISRNVVMMLATMLVILVAAVAYRYDRPGEIPASQDAEDWESSVTSPDILRKRTTIVNDGTKLEADLLIPAGGRGRKGAVVFSTGSGPNTYQDYFGIQIRQKYVQDVFLSRDMAVLYVNKRGMGESEGNWKHTDFQGRADDLYASVRFLKSDDSIDPNAIGLIGHSQGGWIVALTASQHEDVAFVVGLAGPTTAVWEQSRDTDENRFRCDGLAKQDLEKEVAGALRWFRLAATIGRFIPVGEIGYYAGIIDYDPRDVLPKIKVPVLLVFGERDASVPAAKNIQRLEEIFDNDVPENFQTRVIKNATHVFTLTDDMCVAFEGREFLRGEYSDQVVQVLRDWLTEHGY